MTKKSNATIYDIAREANVSPDVYKRQENEEEQHELGRRGRNTAWPAAGGR